MENSPSTINGKLNYMAMEQNFQAWFKELIKEKGWSIRNAANQFEVSHPTISAIVTDGKAPSFETCKKIADKLDKPLEEILRIAGILEAQPDDDPLLDELLHIFNQVPIEERVRLIEIARFEAERIKRENQ